MEMTFNASSATWYRGNDFEDSHLVTDEGTNAQLGISAIQFRQANPVQIEAGVLANVYVKMNRLGFSGTLWKGKDGQQFIRFTPEQRKTKATVDGVEVTRNIDLINLDSTIVAQILRHAERFVTYGAAPAAVSPEQAAYNAQVQAQAEAQRQAQLDAQVQAQMAQQAAYQQQLAAQQQQVAPQTGMQMQPVGAPNVTPGMQAMAGGGTQLPADMFAGGTNVANGQVGGVNPPF